MKFKDIRRFTKTPCYHTTVSLDYVGDNIQRYITEYSLQLNPDFQRGHVWDEAKQIAYIEFLIKGGQSAKAIYFNQPHWMHWKSIKFNDTNCMVLVDGKQRIEAVMKFLRNELPVFGHLLNEYEDRHWLRSLDLDFYINDLATRREVLQWYLDLNTGGVVHTSEEIEKVKKLLETA